MRLAACTFARPGIEPHHSVSRTVPFKFLSTDFGVVFSRDARDERPFDCVLYECRLNYPTFITETYSIYTCPVYACHRHSLRRLHPVPIVWQRHRPFSTLHVSKALAKLKKPVSSTLHQYTHGGKLFPQPKAALETPLPVYRPPKWTSDSPADTRLTTRHGFLLATLL